jgi:cytoskeleton protein RodZ
MSPGDAAHALKLTLRQVEALETDAFQQLPGVAFTRGFLRNYARLVKVAPAPLMEAFDQRHARVEVTLAPVSNARGAMPSGGAGRPSTVIPAALVALGLLAIVVAGWYFDWFRPPPSEAESPRVKLASPPVQEVPPMAAAQAESVAPAPVEIPGATPAPVADAAPPVAPSSGLVAVPAQPAPPGAAPAPDDLERLVFTFDQDAWVEVRDGSDTIIFSRINKAGTSQEVQGRGPFALVVGNAPSVKLSRNGQAVDLASYTKVSVARLKLQ